MKEVLVSFLLRYLRYFARRTLKRHRPTVIGVTGTAGKSSTRQILATVLQDHFSTKVVSGNSETGIPLGILGIKLHSLGFETPLKSIFDWLRILITAPFATNYLNGIQYLVVEMGIDDPYPPKNMEYLLTIVKPDIAIFLNTFAGAVHSMQFEKILPKDRELTPDEKREWKAKAIAAEKAKIILDSECRFGIYNADNSYVTEAMANRKPSEQTKLLTFGKKRTADLCLDAYHVSLQGTEFTFTSKETKATFKVSLSNYVLQEEYQQSLAAAILACLQTELTPKQIATSLEKHFSLPKGRASLLQGILDSVIIDSSYNASRPAVEGMLDLLSTLKKQTKRPAVFLYGDMRELGEEAQKEHELVAEKIIGIVDYLYLVGPLTREYVLPIIQTNEKGFKEIRWFHDAKRAGEYLKESLPKEAIVLVKGSQNTIFLEEAIKYILANKSDVTRLCRQEDYWLKKKNVIQ